MGKDKRDKVILALIIVVALLLLVLAYLFLIRPAISGYTIQAQNQGVQYTVLSILQQIQSQGYVEIPVGNQTLILVPYQPSANQQVVQ